MGKLAVLTDERTSPARPCQNMTTSTDATTLPLAGIRVLDLSRIIAGPNGTMQLADLGAEVIKIESPEGGDDARRMKPPEMGNESAFFLAFNRNKKSVVLNLKSDAGQALFHRMVEKAHVVVENFRPGVTARLKVDYPTLSAINPQLVYCSVSAYGQTGPMSQRPGLDPVLQAEMGLMSLNGLPDGEPLRHPLSLTDLYTGLLASTSICAALVQQRETGQGRHIDLSLMGGAVAMLGNMGTYALATGENPPRMGNGYPTAAPVGAFRGSDGEMFYTACGTERLFRLLASEALERPDLTEDPRFNSNSARVQNREALLAILTDAFSSDTRDNWVRRIRAAGVPAGPVRGIGQALTSEEVEAAGLVHEMVHPTVGRVRLPASSIKLSGVDTPRQPPPTLGQHTDEVLKDLADLRDADLTTLRAQGIIV